MRKKLSGFITIALFLAISSSSLSAAEITRAHIKQVAESFVRSQLNEMPDTRLEITVSRLDPRLKLQSCANPLQARLPGKSTIGRNTTVQVACDDLWSLYVPVRVKRLQQVVVAAHNLGPGSLLNDSALTLGYVDVNQVRGQTIATVEEITGSKVKRHIQQGKPLFHNLICLVCKGDSVTIYARRGGLTIKSSGTALRDGTIGDNIRIKNTSSGRFIDAQVVAVGEVEVSF